jgi:hypothetical protein
MLRINQNSSSAGAKLYYTQADYYTTEEKLGGQELVGVWRGQGAERLGLRGNVDKADWDALCDNRHPGSNLPLTPRKKSERRIGYDFNFHVPKSGKNEDRTTGNMVWGEFVHFTSRPIDGVPDPHLHAHCFVFNTTFDQHEDSWKAGQFSSLKRDAPYFEARFHVRLARRLGELGLDFTRTKKGWELTGLDKKTLDKLGWDYVAALAQGKTALVVSPTHKEGDQITTEIRDRLKRSGQLRGEEHVLQKLESMNLTEVERSEAEQYSPGDVIEFHQNAKGFTKGDRVVIPPISSSPLPPGEGPGVRVPSTADRFSTSTRSFAEQKATLPLEHSKRFQAYRPREISLASGDLIRITKNGQTLDQKHRLNNGSVYRVASFDQRGNVVLDNGWTVSKEFGHFTHGYVMTSHASQGKTVDHVLIGESAQSLPAASREQFYVSASRGRERVTIYTDNKSHLLDAVQRGDNRLTATELVTSDHQRRLATMRKQVIRHHAFQRPNVPPRLPPNPSRHQALDRGG